MHDHPECQLDLKNDLVVFKSVRLALKHLMNKGYIKRKVSIRDARQKIY